MSIEGGSLSLSLSHKHTHTLSVHLSLVTSFIGAHKVCVGDGVSQSNFLVLIETEMLRDLQTTRLYALEFTSSV